jgi:hypothetical protein
VGAPGLAVYLDPVTGRLLSEPPPGEPALMLSQEELEALSRSDLLLFAEPGLVSGTILHLHGAFQSMSVATVGRDGAIQTRCFAGTAPAASAPELPHDH